MRLGIEIERRRDVGRVPGLDASVHQAHSPNRMGRDAVRVTDGAGQVKRAGRGVDDRRRDDAERVVPVAAGRTRISRPAYRDSSSRPWRRSSRRTRRRRCRSSRRRKCPSLLDHSRNRAGTRAPRRCRSRRKSYPRPSWRRLVASASAGGSARRGSDDCCARAPRRWCRRRQRRRSRRRHRVGRRAARRRRAARSGRSRAGGASGSDGAARPGGRRRPTAAGGAATRPAARRVAARVAARTAGERKDETTDNPALAHCRSHLARPARMKKSSTVRRESGPSTKALPLYQRDVGVEIKSDAHWKTRWQCAKLWRGRSKS